LGPTKKGLKTRVSLGSQKQPFLGLLKVFMLLIFNINISFVNYFYETLNNSTKKPLLGLFWVIPKKEPKTRVLLGVSKTAIFEIFYKFFYGFIKLLKKGFKKSDQQRQTKLFFKLLQKKSKTGSSWGPKKSPF
jgi:hypothetical protein